ncbi:hypothetical protein [Bradyrhizobium valentinum]|uniref:Uncharacterized protein n=1 Tax=Bradyrhizobium valentinum TaxID=1518501 RepID=A0A0R3KFI4_9BRAD|nr:hypothetical protein [Bradyrhizobium valentinum]KRQ94456.1 hypothetical protein CQ10_34010 [Bradyrhizobium valentinum]KRR10563.1 hypothetical protein CP49_12340 [Bradyrhizobium valentinum]
MGRPIGSVNKEKPFNDALRIALRGDPLRLRRIADKLATLAEEGDLGAIRELADRLDGKPAQVIDRRGAPIDELTDAQLHLIASGGLSVPQKASVLLIPPPAKVRD